MPVRMKRNPIAQDCQGNGKRRNGSRKEFGRQNPTTLNVCFPGDTASTLGISTRERHYAYVKTCV